MGYKILLNAVNRLIALIIAGSTFRQLFCFDGDMDIKLTEHNL